MESIMQLLFGREAGLLAELLRPDHKAESGMTEAGMAERARRAGEWCASTRGRGIIPVSRLTAYVLGMS